MAIAFCEAGDESRFLYFDLFEHILNNFGDLANCLCNLSPPIEQRERVRLVIIAAFGRTQTRINVNLCFH